MSHLNLNGNRDKPLQRGALIYLWVLWQKGNGPSTHQPEGATGRGRPRADLKVSPYVIAIYKV